MFKVEDQTVLSILDEAAAAIGGWTAFSPSSAYAKEAEFFERYERISENDMF